ncbi:methyl-accepting chemotaxis protein [Halalkalibacter urbisdiaboli]|uniref:methyl-accepting chemotaxis protein n=1 Tax=Halalkalibacter urbisdiaboli TaxID=1960589 RepID=UPI000B437729|nr:methyl-accepting chemotaxis protein [Halalkalibacter urbisdiaboli]
MGLRSKILIGFSLIVLLMLGFSGYTVLNVQQSNEAIESLNEESIPMLLAKERMAFNVAERLALARGYVLLGDSNYKLEFEKLTKESEELSAWIAEHSKDEAVLHITKVNTEWTNTIAQEVFPTYDNGNKEEAKLVLLGKGTSNAKQMMRLFRATGDDARTDITSVLNKVDNSGKSLQSMTLIMAIIVVVGSVIIAFFLSKSILQPIQRLLTPVKLIASGDLTGDEIKTKTKDELGQLTVAFNEMRENLRSLIGKTATMSSQVAATAEQLSASSEETSAATNQIAVTIQGVSTTSEGTVSRSKESSQAAKQVYEGVEKITIATASASDKAEEASKHSKEGEQAITRAVHQIGTIQQTVSESASLIRQLGERSKEIGDILNLITSISEQTNLLALNAAIEAARAGEHGKGFAVVADEVRKLAEESGSSAAKISGMINAIQTDTDKVVEEMSRGTKEVEIGTSVVHEVGQSFSSISASIEQMTEEMLNVSSATQNIAMNTVQLSESLAEMEQSSIQSADHSQEVMASTEEQLAAMEEIASSAEQLNQLASELRKEVKKFTH